MFSEYSSCSRAKIMRRDHNKVIDIDSMKNFMQYNDYINDPFSNETSTESIAARGDLLKTNPSCFGAYDTKIGSVKELKENKTKNIYLYSGPTKQVTPLFNFNSNACTNVSHTGIKDEPNNDWIIFHNKFNFDE